MDLVYKKVNVQERLYTETRFETEVRASWNGCFIEIYAEKQTLIIRQPAEGIVEQYFKQGTIQNILVKVMITIKKFYFLFLPRFQTAQDVVDVIDNVMKMKKGDLQESQRSSKSSTK